VNPLIADFMHDVQQQHAATRYERHPIRLCEAFDMQYCLGPVRRANLRLPAMVVVRAEEFSSRRLFTVSHEVVHILMRRGGYHQRILRENASVPDTKRPIEKLADFTAGLLVMPEPDVREARQLFGETPAAVLYLMRLSGASEGAAMRRWAWQDVTARQGVFVSEYNHTSDTSTCNLRPPFNRWERVLQGALHHPEVSALSVGWRRVMGP